MLSCNFAAAQDPISVRFGDGVILLHLADNQLIVPYLSPDGNYVVAHVASYDGVEDGVATVHFDFNGEASQYLWDLRDQTFSAPSLHLAPALELDIDASAIGPAFAFHPEGRWLAAATNQEIQLRSLPSLGVERSLRADAETLIESSYGFSSTTVSNRLSWSWDGQILGVLVDEEVLTWDAESNTVNRYALNNIYDLIRPTELGWFINEINYPPDTNLITVCTHRLERCHSYEQPPGILSPDGSKILLQSGDYSRDPEVEIWQQQEDRSYSLDKTFSMPILFLAQSFSPDNQFIVSGYQGWAFWDIERSEIAFRLPTSIDIGWLLNSTSLISWNGIPDEPVLKLYRVGHEEPLDVLNLKSVPGLEEIETWDFDTWFQIQDISDDGRRVLVNLGWAALVIPIEYK